MHLNPRRGTKYTSTPGGGQNTPQPPVGDKIHLNPRPLLLKEKGRIG